MNFKEYPDYFYKSLEDIGEILSNVSLLERMAHALSGWACLGICPPVSLGQSIKYINEKIEKYLK